MHKYYHNVDDVPLDSTTEEGVAASLTAGEFQLGRKIGPGTEMYDFFFFFKVIFYIRVYIYIMHILCVYIYKNIYLYTYIIQNKK